MLITSLSVIFALGLFFYAQTTPFILHHFWLIGMVASSFTLLALHVFCQSISLLSLQKAEKIFSASILTLYRKDRKIKFMSYSVSLFPLFSLILGLSFYQLAKPYNTLLLAIWIILVGINLDLIRGFFSHLSNYLDGVTVAKLLTFSVTKNSTKHSLEEISETIDALTDMAIKAIEHSQASLASSCLNELQELTQFFLSIAKKKEHSEVQLKKTEEEVNFTLSYLFQHIEAIHEKALKHASLAVCHTVITTLGKISLQAAKLEMALAAYPLYFLGNCTKKAQEINLKQVEEMAILTLLEVAKALPKERDLTSSNLQEVYFTLITQLHEISKQSFKQDKNKSIALLMQPFEQLKELFKAAPLNLHRDTALINERIDQVLAEFKTLELVLKTLPPFQAIIHPSSSPDIKESEETKK